MTPRTCPLAITLPERGGERAISAGANCSSSLASSASMLLLPQLLLSSASADISAAQPTLSLPLVRRRRHHPRATAHAARHLSQAAPLPTAEAGPFFGSVPSRLLRTQTPTLAHAIAPRDSFIPPLATEPHSPVPLTAAQHRAGLRRLRRPRDAGRGAWGPDLPPGGRHGL